MRPWDESPFKTGWPAVYSTTSQRKVRKSVRLGPPATASAAWNGLNPAQWLRRLLPGSSSPRCPWPQWECSHELTVSSCATLSMELPKQLDGSSGVTSTTSWPLASSSISSSTWSGFMGLHFSSCSHLSRLANLASSVLKMASKASRSGESCKGPLRVTRRRPS